MLTALKPGGHIMFTVSQKHLREDNLFGMSYVEAINNLIEKGSMRALLHQEFVRDLGVFHTGSEERYSLLVF